ncbi:MAG TPA: hypothetical protein VF331_04820 [Polyangiales bacterium]
MDETRDGFLADDAPSRGADDDLADLLGAAYLSAATSGEAQVMEDGDAVFEEESGGPFLEVSGAREFAHGFDASNPEGSDREALPLAVRTATGRRARF